MTKYRTDNGDSKYGDTAKDFPIKKSDRVVVEGVGDATICKRIGFMNVEVAEGRDNVLDKFKDPRHQGRFYVVDGNSKGYRKTVDELRKEGIIGNENPPFYNYGNKTLVVMGYPLRCFRGDCESVMLMILGETPSGNSQEDKERLMKKTYEGRVKKNVSAEKFADDVVNYIGLDKLAEGLQEYMNRTGRFKIYRCP